MKIYAKQVPPEYQESPFFWNIDNYAELYIFGNRNYNGINAEGIAMLRDRLDDLADDWSDLQRGHAWCSSWAEALRAAFSESYSRAERQEWAALANRWPATRSSLEEMEVILDALRLKTGRRWDSCTLRGSCQGDWQECIYPIDDWNVERLERLEAEYFNTGSEWIVHDGPDDPDGPEDIDGFSCYCIAWNDSGIRQEIADAAGGSPENVTLYKFDGYSKIANYSEV